MVRRALGVKQGCHVQGCKHVAQTTILRQSRALIQSGMIFSENRFPLFAIMP
jgi:hypothetical protein